FAHFAFRRSDRWRRGQPGSFFVSAADRCSVFWLGETACSALHKWGFFPDNRNHPPFHPGLRFLAHCAKLFFPVLLARLVVCRPEKEQQHFPPKSWPWLTFSEVRAKLFFSVLLAAHTARRHG